MNGRPAEHGELRSEVRLFADPRDSAVLTRLVSRIVLAGLGGVVGLTSALLLIAGRGPQLAEGLTLLDVLGNLGLAGGLVLVLRAALAALRDAG